MVLMIEIVGRASVRHVGLKADLQVKRTMNQWTGIRNSYLVCLYIIPLDSRLGNYSCVTLPPASMQSYVGMTSKGKL